jgi:hypothetical protein
MKSSFIPAIRCAKKKPGMCCLAILKTGRATGGIEWFLLLFFNITSKKVGLF